MARKSSEGQNDDFSPRVTVFIDGDVLGGADPRLWARSQSLGELMAEIDAALRRIGVAADIRPGTVTKDGKSATCRVIGPHGYTPGKRLRKAVDQVMASPDRWMVHVTD